MIFIQLLQLTICLIIVTTLAVFVILKSLLKHRKAESLQPPMPNKLPFIGHLHLLAGYEVPYQAFTSLSKRYGSIFRLQLGCVKCVVINGHENIREILVTKGHHFDSRPNFERYRQLFCGNKENSLAFCNWSHTQKIRRDMLKTYTFPRAFTNRFYSLEQLIKAGTCFLHDSIADNNLVHCKPIILQVCADIFIRHFCSKKFDMTDENFIEMVNNYDDIFFEVNQGYAADFLPFLMPFHKKNLQRIHKLTQKIRDFVLVNIINRRFDEFSTDQEPNDYVDNLIQGVKSSKLSWHSALFALEDIIGGHSAVGNFIIKLLAFLAKHPEVQTKIQNEMDRVLGRKEVTISDRNFLPYTEATIFEAIRLIASPIVPRVANRDSSIKGFHVPKGTLIFLNNYDLSMSENLWSEPEKFKPERFIRENRLFKPDYFLPFGGGRRSCMGYKMVQLVSFGILGGLLQKYKILTDCKNYSVTVGSLALPRDTFSFKFIKR